MSLGEARCWSFCLYLQYGTVLGDVFGPLLTIYMGKPVGPRFEQMVHKIQNWLSSSWNRVYHLYKSVPFADKRPRRPETGIKDGFSFGIFHPEQTGPSFQLFRCSRCFPLERSKKACYIFFPTRFFRTFL